MAAARLAATQYLLSIGCIDLPRRQMSRWAKGFSGEGYEGWVELPAERVRVTGALLVDRVTAELTLADGRRLLVDLCGEMRPGEEGRAVITINLSDPALAGLDIDQLRARLRVLPPMNWCSHWFDTELASQAQARAVGEAQKALDAWSEEDEAEFLRRAPSESSEVEAQSLRRETLLHRTVKAILDEAKRINTPSLFVSVVEEAPSGYAGGGDSHHVELSWWAPPAHLKFAEVVVERAFGGIVPDIVGRLTQPPPRVEGVVTTKVVRGFDEGSEDRAEDYPAPWPDSILIEVAVTHRVDEAKLQRIEHLDLPALELDLGSLGGRLTLEGLRRLVVDGLEGKRWLHHPALRRGRQRLRSALRLHPEALGYRRFAAMARRPRLLATPVSEWAQRYLTALTAFFDANARIDAIRKTKGPRHLEPLDEDSDEWTKVALAAEALEAHGLPGGADPEFAHTLMTRVLSMKLGRGVGYAYDNAYQVIVAIMNIRSRNSTPWMSIYLIAAWAFKVDRTFTPVQQEAYRQWRDEVANRINASDPQYLRSGRYDAILGALFPPMASFLAQGKGRAPK